MPFWRRNRNEPPTPEVDEPVDPALVDPDWEPDPADFGVLDDGTPVEPLPTTDPLLPFASEPEPAASVMTIDIPPPVPLAPGGAGLAATGTTTRSRRRPRRPRRPSTPVSSAPAATS